MILQKNWIKLLQEKAQIQGSKTKQIRKEVKEKRNKNRAEKLETPDFDRCDKVYSKSSLIDDSLDRDGLTSKSNRINWFHVQSWFVKAILRNNPKWLVVDHDEKENDENNQTWWAWKEKNCAERLLKHYGPNIVENTVNWFCDNWQTMVENSNGRLSGPPTVGFLWFDRDKIFANAKMGILPVKKSKPRKKHMKGEYDAESAKKRPRVGW